MFEYFYNEILRRTIIGFGTLFNGISVKTDSQEIRVPLAYGPTQKFLARLTQSPDLNKGTAIDIGLYYKLNYKTNYIQNISLGLSVFHPVTWSSKTFFVPTYSVSSRPNCTGTTYNHQQVDCKLPGGADMSEGADITKGLQITYYFR